MESDIYIVNTSHVSVIISANNSYLISETEWGMEWTCKSTNLEFCSSEGMCNYPESCPVTNTGQQSIISNPFQLANLFLFIINFMWPCFIELIPHIFIIIDTYFIYKINNFYSISFHANRRIW